MNPSLAERLVILLEFLGESLETATSRTPRPIFNRVPSPLLTLSITAPNSVTRRQHNESSSTSTTTTTTTSPLADLTRRTSIIFNKTKKKLFEGNVDKWPDITKLVSKAITSLADNLGAANSQFYQRTGINLSEQKSSKKKVHKKRYHGKTRKKYGKKPLRKKRKRIMKTRNE